MDSLFTSFCRAGRKYSVVGQSSYLFAWFSLLVPGFLPHNVVPLHWVVLQRSALASLMVPPLVPHPPCSF
ncbi:hypothetical protein FA13DRAFT_1726628 [Coprinellus micaceus]|uniref:Uncharacterized protein n=1 Tax=Coprinellus micaceus TaxID=71717 RepID=A0A4Y7TTK5_COPMI|nr:hypothetical protein FA13DRAFT_1726628 [Coprinellus micaceus]